jgi:hypothetical protein
LLWEAALRGPPLPQNGAALSILKLYDISDNLLIDPRSACAG